MNGFRMIRNVTGNGLLKLNLNSYLSPVVQLGINRKYANVLQSAAIKPDKLDLLEDDLKRITLAINQDEKFKDLIQSKTLNLKEKKSALNRMLNDQFAANELTVKLMNSMIEKDLLKLFLTDDFQKIITNLRNMINELDDQSTNSNNNNNNDVNRKQLIDSIDRQLNDALQANHSMQKELTSSIATVDGIEFKSADSTLNRNLINSWLKLSKFRLTSLVVLTTLTGHYMGMEAFDAQLMFFTLLGTGLCSSSAAALNQFLEIPYDSQMSRTKSRPLVTHNVTPLHAFTFALLTGVSGFTLLAQNVNILTASLGVMNLFLYSFIYTPMKRFNILNTWIGSIVGAIPPIMGYTAATGRIDFAAISLGLILYSWQFPHFNALSWNIKHDYARAGYRMMVVTDPDLCVRTAFRHSCLITLYCELMCTSQVGLNSWEFAFDSLPVNLYLIYLAWKFKENPNAKTSRTLFKFSLVHLPVLLTLLVLSKKLNRKEDELKQVS